MKEKKNPKELEEKIEYYERMGGELEYVIFEYNDKEIEDTYELCQRAAVLGIKILGDRLDDYYLNILKLSLEEREKLFKIHIHNTKPNGWNYGITLKNAKSTLQEFCQKNGLPNPEYKIIKKTGPDHDPTFICEVVVKPGKDKLAFEAAFKLYALNGANFYAQGKASRKKVAELYAAEKMCDELGLDYSESY